jgi:hypothetical protein
MKRLGLVLFAALIVVGAIPARGLAQEASLSGTVTDSTGGALPGVTVTAVHEASGNTFEAVTDERGEYRIPVRVGAYRVTADLAGFTPATRTITLLVGQQAVLGLQLAVSGVQESVTVTGEAPLLDVTQSSLGGNIDTRQLEELPVNGRNWVDLVMLAPGSRSNAVAEQPSEVGSIGPSTGRVGGDFELNIDGQQLTMHAGAGAPEPHFSKDAIAEFEYLSSRFDATQGRSSGMQINAVTKSGTNVYSGGFSGFFRHDRFNSADFVAGRVLPYNDQQYSVIFGGPIRRDRVHFFANYEYEREPRTAVWTTPYPSFNLDLSRLHTDKKGGVRIDAQFSPRTRLMLRGSTWSAVKPADGDSDTTPTETFDTLDKATQLLATLTQVVNINFVNEVKLGYASLISDVEGLLNNPNSRFGHDAPLILLSGLTAGGSLQRPDGQTQEVYSIRDDVTLSFTKGGRHTVKTGAEFLHQTVIDRRCVRCEGELDATNGPVPANIESLFPDLFDVSTWNLRPLSPLAVRWRQPFGIQFGSSIPRYSSAVWLQDDWTVSPRLTLNLGIRYDLELNAFANDSKIGPFLPGNQPEDKNNIGPRFGFTASLNDRTVARGGYGVYFGTVQNGHYAKFFENTITFAVPYDGRDDFAVNPFNGPPPTYQQVLENFCTPEQRPGCIRREVPTGGAVFGPHFKMPYAHQGSLGIQRQLGPVMAVEADYVYVGGRDAPRDLPHNITYNPATGVNYPFNDISRRPFPEWGYVSFTVNGMRSNSHALQTALTKRFSSGWQASGTYTLSWLRDADPRPVQWTGSSFEEVPFQTAPDLGGEYGLAATDQRHRAVLNGVWERWGFQVSGLYFFGSGYRFHTNWGTDLRQIGGVRPNSLRLRPDGTLVPRNNFTGNALHRVDVRLQQRVPLLGRARIDGMLEIFNVFNHANFGRYVIQESSRNYGLPQQSTLAAYQPRTMQLGFRLTF